MRRTVVRSEKFRLAFRIFSLEHELGIGGHNGGYSCMKCWRLEEETGRELSDYTDDPDMVRR